MNALTSFTPGVRSFGVFLVNLLIAGGEAVFVWTNLPLAWDKLTLLEGVRVEAGHGESAFFVSLGAVTINMQAWALND